MTTAVRALGEVALRVNDLERSESFYRDVIGLNVMRRFDDIVFFGIADGHEGHTALLALFDRKVPVSQSETTIDHIAFTISLADFDRERDRLEALGQSVATSTHAWAHYRSLYLADPDGNTVELVCYDPSV